MTRIARIDMHWSTRPSTAASPDGGVMFRWPRQASGIGVFDLGDTTCT